MRFRKSSTDADKFVLLEYDVSIVHITKVDFAMQLVQTKFNKTNTICSIIDETETPLKRSVEFVIRYSM